MLCPECGKEYENAYGFCPWCGAVSRPEPADTAGAGSTADAAGSPQQAIIQGLPASMVPRMSPAKRSTVWLLCFILAAGICIYGSVSFAYMNEPAVFNTEAAMDEPIIPCIISDIFVPHSNLPLFLTS